MRLRQIRGRTGDDVCEMNGRGAGSVRDGRGEQEAVSMEEERTMERHTEGRVIPTSTGTLNCTASLTLT